MTSRILLVVVASAFGFVFSDRSVQLLQPFDTLKLEAPVNVKLDVAKGHDSDSIYQLITTSKGDSSTSLRATVKDSTLMLAATSSFGTQEDFSVTVLVPAKLLQKVQLSSPASLYLAPGFEAQSLTLAVDSLAGSIAATDVTIDKLTLQVRGVSDIKVDGSINSADVTASGSSGIFLSGLQKRAILNLSGAAKASIISDSSEASIEGKAESGEVLFHTGSCSVQGSTPGRSVCRSSNSLAMPATAPFLICDITIQGSGAMAMATSKICKIEEPGKTPEDVKTARRSLRQATDTSNALAAAQALLQIGSFNSKIPTSYQYSSTSLGSDGSQIITSCSFFNNNGGCQVNGTPVPAAQVISTAVPSPGPAQEEVLNKVADVISNGEATQTPTTAASTTSSSTSSTSSTSGGGSTSASSCTFVNGVGGCTTG